MMKTIAADEQVFNNGESFGSVAKYPVKRKFVTTRNIAAFNKIYAISSRSVHSLALLIFDV